MATNTLSNASHLKQAALYLEKAVVADPAFELTDFRIQATEVFTMASTPKVDRQKLAKAASSSVITCLELEAMCFCTVCT
ncbi:hypothetical protein [Vibrio splendidus]|uniref:hypothetical protein n=1 Tax=Vibrio splendidus TaxID=29497 RepID=UPI0024690303|nr:hypothetical protein [Vibrio splendidus]MDH6017707.1 hypothetical protein [Vibrio splendidus]